MRVTVKQNPEMKKAETPMEKLTKMLDAQTRALIKLNNTMAKIQKQGTVSALPSQSQQTSSGSSGEKSKDDAKKARAEAVEKFWNQEKNMDAGIENLALSAAFGPAGVLLGKAWRASKIWPTAKAGLKMAGTLFGKKGSSGGGNGNDGVTGAVAWNEAEMARAPLIKLTKITEKGFKDVLAAIGGGKPKEKKDEKSLLEKAGGWIKGLLGGLLKKALPWLGALGAGLFGAHYLHKLGDKYLGDGGGTAAVMGGASMASQVGKGLQNWGTGLAAARGASKGAISAYSAAAKKVAGIDKALKGATGFQRGTLLATRQGARATQGAALTALKNTPKASAMSGAVGKLATGAGKLLRRTAGVGVVFEAGLGGWDAYKQYQAGDTRAGNETVAKTGGSIVGGLAGAKAGALAGATLGSIIPGIGTGIGAVLGGAIGALGGSKLGRWVSGKAYDAVDPEEKNIAISTGDYSTAMSTPYDGSQETMLSQQNAILDTLRQIEINLRPETQMAVDNNYLNDIQLRFASAPMPYSQIDDTNAFNLNVNSSVK